MSSIRVVNVRHERCDVYVERGQGSLLGNPFRGGEHGRDRCIELYRAWLTERIAERDPAVCGALDRIYRAAVLGPVTLGCWCAPQRCHAEVIAEVVMEALSASNK